MSVERALARPRRVDHGAFTRLGVGEGSTADPKDKNHPTPASLGTLAAPRPAQSRGVTGVPAPGRAQTPVAVTWSIMSLRGGQEARK